MSLAVDTALLNFVKNNAVLSTKRWVIGYSGGRDSHVLLHTMAQFHSSLPSLSLKAIHVNHQLHSEAEKWAEHCQKTARTLGIECKILRVDLELKKGESLEAKAREKRYQAIVENLSPNDILLTAHTQDDQAETLVLQLIRGAGVQGLSCMGVCKPLGHTFHYRPLLSVSREDIEMASIAYGLTWITDDSNENIRFDRNFIRHEILPLLKARFKGVVPSLARSAQLCQEAARAQEAQAHTDFKTITRAKGDQIEATALIRLPFERQKAAIRYWIAKNGYAYPSKVKLEDIIHQINTARLEAQPCIKWLGGMVRRYHTHWYILPPIEKPNLEKAFTIQRQKGQGFRGSYFEDLSQLTIHYRQGGERCKPTGHPFSKSLKKWFQIFNIPTWVRDTIPLVYYQDTLIGALGYFICEGWQANAEEEGVEILLQSHQTEKTVLI